MPSNRSNMQPIEVVEREAARLAARYEALEECAGYLDLEPTDDPLKRMEWRALAGDLRRQAGKVRNRYQKYARAVQARRARVKP